MPIRQWSPMLACALLLPAAVSAAPNLDATRSVAHFRDHVVEVTAAEADIVDIATFAAAGSRILYVNRCEGGETIIAGAFNDSRTNRSTVPDRTVTLPEYPFGNASWNQVVAEVREILSPFGVEVVDVNPGNVPHFEIIACGESFFGPNVLGVAPSACGIVENGIGFAFAEEHGNAPRFLAETIVHEAGHIWTMDHLFNCEDPMTYLSGCGDKAFQDEELRCATVDNNMRWVTKDCKCGGSTMNSYATLLEAFGPSAPTPPVVRITSPFDGQVVQPGFVVRADVADADGVDTVTLLVDGAVVFSLETTPYAFNAPATLAEGSHRVEIRATDRRGTTGSSEITVTVGDDCGCAAAEVCIDGTCQVPPEPQGGGLGDACADNADCDSGVCGSDGAQQICTQVCTGSCPGGFSCEPAGGVSVCWPAADDGSNALGGCAAGGQPGGPWVALFALLGLLWRRRRA